MKDAMQAIDVLAIEHQARIDRAIEARRLAVAFGARLGRVFGRVFGRRSAARPA